MTRTTLNLDASVLEQLRSRACAEHKSVGQLASELLAVTLREDAPATPREDASVESTPLRWLSTPMGRPMIDLRDIPFG